jgi:hypothetical protein
VPSGLVDATLKAATTYAAAPVATAISSSVASLIGGTLREMLWHRIQIAAGLLLAVTLLGAGAGLLAYESMRPDKPGDPAATLTDGAALEDGGLAESIAQRVAAWQPTRAERRIDEIGWVKDLGEARRLAQKHNRPMFVLTHGGNIATARCLASAFHIRASALSSERVIQVLNRHYVCVHLNTKDYLPDGKATAEDRAEYARLREAAAAFPAGGRGLLVCLLDPDGRMLECREACYTANTETVAPLLERLVTNDRSEGPVVVPIAQSQPPQASADDLVLHLTARYLERKGDALVPPPVELGQNTNYFMKGLPGENWLLLNRAQWSALLPPATVEAGATWEIDSGTTALLYQNMYPPTEDNKVAANRIDRATLAATLLARDRGVARARLDGTLRMKHRFDPGKDDNRFVDAKLTGFVDFTTNPPAIRALQLVSTQATYGKSEFGVAVRSLRR